MKFFYLRTLFVILCVWLMTGTALQAQPDGKYGPRNAKYSVPSGAYFVSPTGKGGTPCSQGNPCSLSKALSSAPSGTTIVLRKGTYRTSDFDAKIPRKLTLQPYPGEEVILKGSKVANSWKSQGGSWSTNWKTLYPANYNRKKSNVVTSENPMAAHQDMVFVNGKPLKQVSSKNAVKSGTFYVDYGRKTIYIGTNPGGKQVEITASSWGLHTHGVKASGITVRGLKFMHYAETGIMLKSPDAVIEDNEFVQNAVAGIKIYGAKRAKVRNNLFSENGLQGLGVNEADHLLLENNIIIKNNSEKFNRNSWSAAGAKILLSPNSTIRNNLFKDNDANGVWLDNRSHKTKIVNNMISNNTRHGIHCEISYDAIIAGNVVTGCGFNTENLVGGGIMVANSSNVKVFNNTLLKNYINLQVADIKRGSGSNMVTRNTIVKNNIFSDATVSAYPSSQMWVRALKCGDAIIKELDNNGYHKSSSKQADLLIRWKVSSSCSKAERHESLTSLSKALGFGKKSIAFMGSDPFFENRNAGNYKLKKGSKALKAGVSLPDDVKKALGWNKGGSVDLGAYQSGYAAAPSAPSAPSAPAAGNLPWQEDFNSSRFKGATETGKMYTNAILKAKDGRLLARGVGEAVYKSDVIKLGGKAANFSVVLGSKGNLEPGYDNVKVYYRLNNGSEKLAGQVTGKVSGNKVISAKGLKGNTLQVIVKIKNSDITEHYFVDNIKVEAAGSNARVADVKKKGGESEVVQASEEMAVTENSIDVYPNPVESFLEVQVNSVESYNTTMVLLDMNGRKVHENQASTNEAVSLDLSSLQTGVYLLQIIDEEGNTETKRILKQ